MKKGLILEGGAMRGLFTAGVMDVMMENNIKFDGAIGVSAGAAFGCNYKSHQIGRVLRYNTKYCADKRYCGLASLMRTGNIYSTDFCYGEVPLSLDIFDFDTFEADPMEFYVVCTDVETGKAVYHNCDKGEYEDLEWMRASASMPMVSTPVEIDGCIMLDGGMTDSIPLKHFEEIGYDRNIVILTQPVDYVKEKNPLLPVAKYSLRKYPKAYEAFSRRHEVYNETTQYIKEKEARGEVLVIRPPHALEIKKTERDPAVLKSVYDIGRATGEKELERVKEFLGIEE